MTHSEISPSLARNEHASELHPCHVEPNPSSAMTEPEREEECEGSFTRAYCRIARTHHRFLLRQLECTQQYAPIYRCRLEQQEERVLHTVREALLGVRPPVGPTRMFSEDVTGSCSASILTPTPTIMEEETTSLAGKEANQREEEIEKLAKGPSNEEEKVNPDGGTPCFPQGWREASTFRPCRIIDLQVDIPAVVIGVTYKQMKRLPQFLKDYQKELLRLDAGDGSGEDNDIEDGGLALPLEEEENALRLGQDENGDDDEEEGACPVCSPTDEVYLEDSSGRMTLQHVNAGVLCTGLVLAVYGRLTAEGGFSVEMFSFCGLHDLYLSPRRRSLCTTGVRASTSPHRVTHAPNYIGFLSGLSLDVSPDPATALRIHLLVDFIRGEVGSPAVREKARRISRLVIGGNHLMSTEEMKLKKKVKLEPPDHVRLKLNHRETQCTSALVMTRHLDALLTSLCESVEVELMPGDRDMSNAFFPQQPIHPVLLPTAARYSTLRLVTNPYEFTLFPCVHTDEGEGEAEEVEEVNETQEKSGKAMHPSSTDATSRSRKPATSGIPDVTGGVHFFVSAGQNVNDIARQTDYTSRLDILALLVRSGCACPTAPNTLWSYPFEREDPFLFPRCPHVVVACEQPRFETGWMRMQTGNTQTATKVEAIEKKLHTDTISKVHKEENEEDSSTNRSRTGGEEVVPDGRKGGEGMNGEDGVRLVCVPPFRQHGVLVLVDINSPTFESSTIDFTFLEGEK